MHFIGGGDSVLVVLEPSAGQIELVAMHALDERGGDTVRVARSGLRMWNFLPSLDGRFLATTTPGTSGTRYEVVTDRTGKGIDSIAHVRGVSPIGWSTAGLVLEARDTVSPELAAIVERRVSREGKPDRHPRVLVASQSLSHPRIAAAGISYLAGPEGSVLYEGARTAAAPGTVALRKVLSTTADMGTLMSGDGLHHIVMRTPRVDQDQSVTQVTLMPFGGGAERQLSVGVRETVDRSRTTGGDAILFVHRDGARNRITRFDLATGRTQDLGVMPDTADVQAMEVMHDGSSPGSRPPTPHRTGCGP